MAKAKIFLGTDHAGFLLKEEIKKYLKGLNYEVKDQGAYSFDAEDDYPKFIFKAAEKVASNKGSKGIIFGGSGQGEAIAANKINGIRAAVFYGNNFDIIKLSRKHNDSNILSLGARIVSIEVALKAVKLWLDTDFTSEERHKRRLNQIENLEKKMCR